MHARSLLLLLAAVLGACSGNELSQDDAAKVIVALTAVSYDALLAGFETGDVEGRASAACAGGGTIAIESAAHDGGALVIELPAYDAVVLTISGA